MIILEDICLSVSRAFFFNVKLQGQRDSSWYCRQFVYTNSLPLKTGGAQTPTPRLSCVHVGYLVTSVGELDSRQTMDISLSGYPAQPLALAPPPTGVLTCAEALTPTSGRFLGHVLVPLPPLPNAKHLDQGG